MIGIVDENARDAIGVKLGIGGDEVGLSRDKPVGGREPIFSDRTHG